MKKLRFLLLDANVVIELFELRLWPQIIERCEVLLAETVVNEARYCEAGEEQRRIDLSQDIQEKRVSVVHVETIAIDAFRAEFDPSYFDRLTRAKRNHWHTCFCRKTRVSCAQATPSCSESWVV